MTEQTERSRSGTAQPQPRRAPHGRIVAPRPLGEVRTWPRSFADRLTAPLPGVMGMSRLARERALRPNAEGLRGIDRLPYAPGPLPVTPEGTTSVTWAGHASWIIRTGGLTVLADPVWSRRILGTPARITPVGVRWEDLPPVDAVVISHNHYDHLDAPTLRRLPRDTPLLVPAGLGRWCQPAPLHLCHRTRLVGIGRARRGPLRLRTGPSLVQADPHRHLPLPLGRLDRHRPRPRSAADPLRRGQRLRALVRRDRQPVPRDRPDPPADRRVRTALVARRRTHRSRGGRAGVRGPRRPCDGADALGHLPALRGTRTRTADPAAYRLATGRTPTRPALGPADRRLAGTGTGAPHDQWLNLARVLRHTAGTPLTSSVRPTAATTPCHGSGKSEPPRIPISWYVAAHARHAGDIATGEPPQRHPAQQARQHHRNPPGGHQPGQHQHRRTVLVQLPLRLRQPLRSRPVPDRPQPLRAVLRPHPALTEPVQTDVTEERRGRGHREDDQQRERRRLMQRHHRGRTHQRARRHHRHQRPQCHQQEQRRIADRLLRRLRGSCPTT